MAAPSQTVRRLGVVALAAALPLLFLHVSHRPGVTVGSVSFDLADLLVLVTFAAAAVSARQEGIEPLRRSAVLYACAAALLAWILVDTFIPALGDADYAWRTHLVTAGKFGEYALLAVSVPLLVRRPAELRLPLLVLLVWGAAASAYGLLELLTGIGIGPAGRRKPSFIGFHDFAAVSGAILAVGLAGIAFGWRRRDAAAAATAVGAVGVVVSGAVSALVGVLAATAAVLAVAGRRQVLERRQAVTVVAVAAAVAVGTAALRGPQVEAVLRFVGIAKKEQQSGSVESYAHRGVLAYIGLRIFRDHPVLGAGWQASTAEEATYGPYLADARRRYPDQPAEAFPSPAHPWGVQNAYIQSLADLGLVGFAAFGATLGAGLVVGVKTALRASPDPALVGLAGACWILVAGGVLLGIGLVGGIALDAVLWLGIGLVAAGRAYA